MKVVEVVVAKPHRYLLREYMDSGQNMYEPMCSCGWKCGAMTNDATSAHQRWRSSHMGSFHGAFEYKP